MKKTAIGGAVIVQDSGEGCWQRAAIRVFIKEPAGKLIDKGLCASAVVTVESGSQAPGPICEGV
jgi:hypothetical protein